MDERDKKHSIEFYHQVCNIIGSEDVVIKRRQIYTTKDFVDSSKYITYLYSGSRSEGLDLEGSDLDIMFIADTLHVYESFSDIMLPWLHENLIGQHDALTDILLTGLAMDATETKPGFTLLKICGLITNVFDNISETRRQNLYLSSKLWRDQFLKPGEIIHGPCSSEPNGLYDYVRCLRRHKWISSAQNWMYRSRSSWPSNSLVSRIVNFGVLFVPIGCKGSCNENIEWRMSFSVAEKHLIHSFNHVQFLCYSLLKILLKDFIKVKHGDLICSYFLKTIMLWLCEELEQCDWKPDNFLICFMHCFKRLVYCVEYKTCLHYFIPENNFFEDRFTRQEHADLLSTLKSLYNIGWSCILSTETFLSYSQNITLLKTPKASSLGCMAYFRLVNKCQLNRSFKRALAATCVGLSNKKLGYYWITATASLLCQQIPFNIRDRNKHFYKRYKKCRSYYLMGLNSDALSGWLLLASFYYTWKQYCQCIDIIEYCISKCTSDTILSSGDPDISEQSRFEDFLQVIGKRRYNSLMKHGTASFVILLDGSNIMPTELKDSDINSDDKIPCVVFAYFLKFLCCHHLQDFEGKRTAFNNLKQTATSNYLMLTNDSHVKTALFCLLVAHSLLMSE